MGHGFESHSCHLVRAYGHQYVQVRSVRSKIRHSEIIFVVMQLVAVAVAAAIAEVAVAVAEVAAAVIYFQIVLFKKYIFNIYILWNVQKGLMPVNPIYLHYNEIVTTYTVWGCTHLRHNKATHK